MGTSVVAIAATLLFASVSFGAEGESEQHGVELAESLGLQQIPSSNLTGEDIDCTWGTEVAPGVVYCLDSALPDPSDPTYDERFSRLVADLLGDAAGLPPPDSP